MAGLRQLGFGLDPGYVSLVLFWCGTDNAISAIRDRQAVHSRWAFLILKPLTVSIENFSQSAANWLA
jgi:hypothetical protein